MIDLIISLLLFNTPIVQFDFAGNESVSNKVLIKELISKKGDEYNEVSIDFDIQRLIRFYQSQGFFDAKITVEVNTIEKGIQLVFNIQEGARAKVKEITINGAHKEKLKDLFAIEVGDFFIESKIIETKENITDHYKNRGFAYAEITSTIDPNSGIITFTVERGLVYYIRNIEIEGLKSCKPSVLLREIEFKKGDKFSKTDLLKSQRRIYALGFFGTIKVDLVQREPDSVDLVFGVKELKSRIMNFGIGLSIPLSFLISFGFEELNLFNLGHRFQIRPSFKINIDQEWEAKLEGRYTVPYVTPYKLSVSILPFVWYDEQKTLTRQTRGNEFRLSKSFTENIQFNIANQYKYVVIRLKPGEILPDTIKGITNSIRFQFMFDYRDEFFNPKKGLYVLPFLEYAGGIFKGANHFVRLEVENRFFLPVLGHTLAQRLRLGVTIPTNGCGVYEKYSLGGQYSLRGYPEKSLGPDSIGEEKYGNLIGNYNLELRISLPWNFGLIGFFDVGYIDNDIDLKNSDFFKTSAGLGVRYYTPIGPARLDIGFPLAESGREIYLGIYHIF